MTALLDWRPIVGCSPISPGCANCIGVAGAPADVVRAHRDGRAWTGALRLDRAALDAPGRIAAPADIVVCANGDLFHERAGRAWLDLVFDAMEASRRHRYLILTKRAPRMRVYLAGRFPAGVPANIHVGVSAERQREADARLADLAGLPAAVRFAYLYPLLGPVDVRRFLPALAYVVAGAEPQRPAEPAWFAAIAAECAAAGVPFTRCDAVIP